MHIILTHEQADFDALASLLGAHLLDESAVPVLPRRMNRNVSAFLMLYGVDLPFVDPRDLGNEPIDNVTLVDTQSMVSIRGMVDRPQVRVIDHHPRRENLPADWNVTILDLGATTTLIVEALREHNGHLALVEATLLLLGIYEDTGSLTYSRTTARDLRAAAYLIEQGASLEIASDFLNLPLSPEQQALYDRLRRQANHYHIHGHTVIVAGGDAHEVESELSSIAHKLRDLLDPDALFLVIQTRGGVQIIARSTRDQIDVSEIAAHFGGGGHERAAAALIREGRRESIQAELVRILPAHVRPAINVAQIMSRGPQLLPPDTPAEEAARRMRRYGYEGYPVVQQGKVVGLLTRRAVDRALAHKLNLTASSLMDAGEVTVTPETSVEDLQRLMTDSGWGQIPVVSPDDGKIIGIVTRTDLLKTLAPHTRLPRYQNLANRLEAALPLTRLALLRCTAQLAHEKRLALYIVGGFVRDLLIGHPSQDFDLVVEGDAIALAHALADKYGGRVTSHARFGTAKWHIAPIRTRLANRLLAEKAAADLLSNTRPVRAEDLPASLDLVSARTEFYTHPTALPTVERGSIKLDLHRRDFTINTLALRMDGNHYGELHDYWGGLDDLRQGLVRVLHSLSFVDDPTRMLRAVRFEQRFIFRIEPRTLELMLAAKTLLDRVSGDRIRHEIDHILDESRRIAILDRLSDLSLLAAIHPALPWDSWLRTHLSALPARLPDEDWQLDAEEGKSEFTRNLAYTIWFIRLAPDESQAIMRRLKFPAGLRRILLAAGDLWRAASDIVLLPPSAVTRQLEEYPPLARYAVHLAADDPQVRDRLERFTHTWQFIVPLTDGHSLRALGIPPGPVYREILDLLRTAWLDGRINTPAEESDLLHQILESHSLP